MVRTISLGLAGFAAAVLPTATFAASIDYNLRLTVPVHCTVRHSAAGGGLTTGQAVSLGTFREYCNAPGGYALVVQYTPGTLQGATIIAGGDEIVLNGSGQAILSRSDRPRVRERALSVIPGAGGFDTDHLELQLIPAV